MMTAFARETGLTSEKAPRRYLWTDAFAICNFLALHRQTGQASDLTLAKNLVDQVHHVLGRHREDDPRTGWISGLDEESGEQHPTAGGLRIGKPLNERAPHAPYDAQLEWERDGQYYHYLTKWMHALRQIGAVTRDPTYLRWAVELAKTAHRAFTYRPSAGGPTRMVWKMSIDLSRPLVPSMGQHDPLDGLITCQSLQAPALDSLWPEATETPDLTDEITEIAHIAEDVRLVTDDPLGLGGLLADAYRVAQLRAQGGPSMYAAGRLLDAAARGLSAYVRERPLDRPAAFRLAFRKLGLAIGLQAVTRLRDFSADPPGRWDADPSFDDRLDALEPHLALIDRIEDFWLDPDHRAAESWTEHRDINRVMLATCLLPDGYLQFAELLSKPRSQSGTMDGVLPD
jgi:hypothetical protein